jgi:hypothetical protein
MVSVSRAKPDLLPPNGKLLPYGQCALEATSRKGRPFFRPNPVPCLDFGSTRARVVRSREPNLSPIDEFAPRASTKGHMRASAHRTLQVDGIAELAHLSGPIHDELVDPPLDASLPAA